MVLLALFGAVMGQGVVWYTGQFYAQSFLETKALLNFEQSRTIMLWAILFATPFFIFFGWLSDKVGRKWIMLLGMLIAILTYRPIFGYLLDQSDTGKWEATVIASGNESSVQTDFVPATGDSLVTTTQHIKLESGGEYLQTRTDTLKAGSQELITGKTVARDKKLPGNVYWKFVGLVFLLILYVTMVYGPIAAFLVELFPVRIRYTSMSLPYHIGNGVFGGLVPFIGVLLQTTFTADPLVGLWYPIAVAALCFIIGAVYLSNRIDRNVND